MIEFPPGSPETSQPDTRFETHRQGTKLGLVRITASTTWSDGLGFSPEVGCHLPLAVVDHLPGRIQLTRQRSNPNVVYVQTCSNVDFLLYLPNKRADFSTRRSGSGCKHEVPRSCGTQHNNHSREGFEAFMSLPKGGCTGH